MECPPHNDLCSVCHGNFHTPCQANCSHWFCEITPTFLEFYVIINLHPLKSDIEITHNSLEGDVRVTLETRGVSVMIKSNIKGCRCNCIMLVWHHGSAVQPCKCPLCRRQITLLVPTEDSLRQSHDPEVAQVLRNIETYNRLFGGRETGLVQRIQDLPFLLRRLLREFLDPQRSLPLVIRARVYIAMILSAVYIISPIDIIPEGILGIVGLLDDLLIVLICFLHVAALYRSVLYLRHGGS